jgi:hypothetical protein
MISKPLLKNETMKTAFLILAISAEIVFIPMDLTTLMIINLKTKLIREIITPRTDLIILSLSPKP